MAGMTSRQSLTSRIPGFSQLLPVFYIPAIMERTDNKQRGSGEKKALKRRLREAGERSPCWLPREREEDRMLLALEQISIGDSTWQQLGAYVQSV